LGLFFSVSRSERLLSTTTSFRLFGWLSFVVWWRFGLHYGFAGCHK
jgi:hypothetical protein